MTPEDKDDRTYVSYTTSLCCSFCDKDATDGDFCGTREEAFYCDNYVKQGKGAARLQATPEAIRAAVQQERERCAGIARQYDYLVARHTGGGFSGSAEAVPACECAKAIIDAIERET